MRRRRPIYAVETSANLYANNVYVDGSSIYAIINRSQNRWFWHRQLNRRLCSCLCCEPIGTLGDTPPKSKAPVARGLSPDYRLLRLYFRPRLPVATVMKFLITPVIVARWFLTLNRLKEFRLAIEIGGTSKEQAGRKRSGRRRVGDKRSPRTSN
jgi:hypothetical protein